MSHLTHNFHPLRLEQLGITAESLKAAKAAKAGKKAKTVSGTPLWSNRIPRDLLACGGKWIDPTLAEQDLGFDSDYFKFKAGGIISYDIFGSVPVALGWIGRFQETLYFDDTAKNEGLIYVKYYYAPGWQEIGKGRYTAFYFKKVDDRNHYILMNLAVEGEGEPPLEARQTHE